MSKITIDSIVQINEKGQSGWIGCLVQVEEIKTWGIQGFVQLPMQGKAYIRLPWHTIEHIGEAIMKPEELATPN